MKIHDISLMIRPDMPVWPGDPEVKLFRQSKIENGDLVNVSILEMCVHTGTHVDAPYHFIPDGGTVEVMPLDILVGQVQVVEIPETVDKITAEHVARLDLISGVKRLLFKTRSSTYWKIKPDVFQKDFVGLAEDGARALVERNIQLVGIDYLSIAPFTESKPPHDVLLGAKVILIEGLDLSEIQPGLYTLYCLPLKLSQADGAPARVILIED